MTTRQYLCIFLPMWSTDLLKLSRERSHESALSEGAAAGVHETPPILLYAKINNQLQVARFCRKAQALGAKSGMSLSMAKVFCGKRNEEPLCLLFEGENDFNALCRLAVWALRFAPYVAIDKDLLEAYRSKSLCSLSSLHNGLILDISGTERVHHGVDSLIERIEKAFSKRKVEVRMAAAPTAGAAWALSRFSRKAVNIITHEASLTDVLSLFPLSSLRLDPETVQGLKQVGLERIGDLLKLPRNALAGRFGPQVLRRLEQALGLEEEALLFAHPKEVFEAERSFEIPLHNHESLRSAVLNLFELLLRRLECRGSKASSFFIEISKLDADRSVSVTAKEISLFHASASKAHITSIIEPIIEAVKTEEGVSKIKLSAGALSNASAAQKALPGVPKASRKDLISEETGEFLNHLTVRLGKDRVLKVCFENSWIPEKSFSYKPLGAANKKDAGEPAGPADRPPLFLNPPQLVDVLALMPDSPPARISWSGHRLKVLQGSGPERISEEWWHSALIGGEEESARDYFKIQDETGRWLWVFRNHKTAQWFVQGIWA